MLGLFDILSKFIVAEKIVAVEPIQPTACVVGTVEQKPAYDFDTDSSLHKFVAPFSSLQNDQLDSTKYGQKYNIVYNKVTKTKIKGKILQEIC